MLEVSDLLLLGRHRMLEVHLIELTRHHLLGLHICEFLLHHCHLCWILLLGRMIVAFSGLAGAGVAHDHAFHHVCEGVRAKASGLLTVWLASTASHCFVEH